MAMPNDLNFNHFNVGNLFFDTIYNNNNNNACNMEWNGNNNKKKKKEFENMD